MNSLRKIMAAMGLLAALLLPAWFALASASDADTAAKLMVTAGPVSDSIVEQVFANELNEALIREYAPESLPFGTLPEAEPTDPHELSEYGDSPRVRFFGETPEEGYLVYRESFVLIPEADRNQYTLTYSEDKRTATLTPAIPAPDLQGKTGIVLLGPTLMDDEILVFGGTPAADGDSLVVPLADRTRLRLTSLFNDGHFSEKKTVYEADDDDEEEPLLRNTSSLKGISITNPLHKDVSGTNWSGRIYDVLPDLNALDINPDISITDTRINLAITLGTTAKFEFTSTGATGKREKVEVGSIPIPLPIPTGELKMTYSVVVQFDDTPVHVAGTLNNRITWSMGIGLAYLKDFKNEIHYTTFEVGRAGAYFSDDAYANRDIKLYIGGNFDYRGSLLGVDIPFLGEIGPILSLTAKFDAGSETVARWEKDTLDPDTFDRTADSVHICLEKGKKGCLAVKSEEYGCWELEFKIDILIKKWPFTLTKTSPKLLAKREYYHSLTFGSGLKEGVCPHLYYRVPVRVWLDCVGGTPMDGFSVYPAWIDTTDEGGFRPMRDTTSNGGRAVLYLPWEDNTKYEILATGRTLGGTLAGSARQPSFMARGNNETVNIVIGMDNSENLTVKKNWVADADGKDRPEQVTVVLQKWNGSRWSRVDNYQTPDGPKPGTAVLKGNADSTKDWTYTFSDLPRFETVNGSLIPVYYRVRELDGQGYVVHDPNDEDIDDGEMPYAVFSIGAYTDSYGEVIPEHESKYLVEYDSAWEGDNETLTITNTAVYDISLYKYWKDIPEGEHPNYVWLVLLGRDITGGNTAFTPVTGPLPGTAELYTLEDVIDGSGLILDVPHIAGRALALGQVSEENNWSFWVTVPKYRNGIPQEFQAAELSGTIVRDMLLEDYGIEAPASMFTGDYVSTPGTPYTTGTDYELSAVVINTADDGTVPVPSAHTIGGVKIWNVSETNPSRPEYVTLEIRKAGQDEPVATVQVRKPSDYPAFNGRNVWPWTLTDPAIDAAEEYTITEVMPDEYADKDRYYTEVQGMNVINIWTENNENETKIRIRKIWDSEYQVPTSGAPQVSFDLMNGGEQLGSLTLRSGQTDGIITLQGNYIPEEIALFTVKEDLNSANTSGLVFVPVVSGPAEEVVDGELVYTFTVENRLQKTMEITVVKNWKLSGDTHGYGGFPNTVRLHLYRNGEEVWARNFLRPSPDQFDEDLGMASSGFETVKRDTSGNLLKRLDENGNPYTYTVTESYNAAMLEDGETSGYIVHVEQKTDSRTDNRKEQDTVTVTNEWVDQTSEDYVTVTGKKTWDDENDKDHFRPERLSVSIINDDDELVRTFEVTGADGWKWSVSGLPRWKEGRNGEKTERMYYVVESQADGYTPAYTADYDPQLDHWSNFNEVLEQWTNFDEETHTWTCDITNTLTGHFRLKVKKEIEGGIAQSTDIFTFTLKAEEKDFIDQSVPMPRGVGADGKLTITGAGEKELDFLFSGDGIYLYDLSEEKDEGNSVYEYDTADRGLFIIVSPKLLEDGTPDGVKREISCFVFTEGEPADGLITFVSTNEVTFTNKMTTTVKVKKEWDIDIEGKDHPDSIEAVIQEKKGDKWETVKLIELGKTKDDSGSETTSWEKAVVLPKYRIKEGTDNEQEEIEYRVRELSQEDGLLKTLQDLVNQYAGKGKDKFDEWLGELKKTGKSWFDDLPDDLKDAADQGFDKLAEKLDAKENEVYEKLLEKIQFYSAEDRIVYDKDDSDKPEKKDDEKEEPETNAVSYKVEEYTSLTGSKVEAHETKYKVSYKKKTDDSTGETTYIIGNQAIMEADVVKRWLLLGDAEEDDKPDSVFLVLLFKVDSDMAEKAGNLGVDVSKYVNIELPVFNLFDGELFTSGLISGGMNPITLVSEVVAGVDIDIFGLGDKVLKIAVAKVGEDDNWTAHFVMSKYMFGIPVEYKGAELGSEILRQVIKYLLHVDLSVSYTPFGNYISIPGKAYGNLAEISLSNLFDLDDSSITGKIAGKVLDLVTEKLTDWIKEIAPDGLPIGLDDWQRVANVINIKIGIDLPTSTSVTKFWVNDEPGDRPDWIKLRVTATRKDGTTEELEVSLDKDDFGDEDEWTVELNDWEEKQAENDQQSGERQGGEDSGDGDEGEDEDENPITDAEITAEIFPEGFDSSKYEQKIDGAEAINTLKVPGKVIVFGRKVWDDGDNADGKRPEKLTIRLLSKTGEGEWMPVTREVQKTDKHTGQITNETKEVTAETSAAGNWKYFFTDLPEKDGDQLIAYRVEETEVPEEYEVSGGTKEEGYNLTNKREQDRITVSGEKTWDDRDNQDGRRPDSITVYLYADGVKVPDAEQKVYPDAEGKWRYTFANVLKNKDGKEIAYSVMEDPVPEGYSVQVSGMNLTNTHVPETVDVTARKEWEDGKNADGLRPDQVTLKLNAAVAEPDNLQNPEVPVPEPAETGEADGWEYTFTELPKYHEGQEITYTADEEAVPDGYTKTTEGLTVTNTHEIETITVLGTKAWEDADNADGLRPGKVWVYLVANGRVVDAKEIAPTDGETDNWSFSFENVPKNAGGQPITYTIDEEAVPGYTKEITGNMNQGFRITNTHIQGTISVSGAKTWDDADDQDGIRPDEILVTLLWKGSKYDNRSVTAATGWKYTFPNIPLNYAGSAADWEIVETTPDGYTAGYSEVLQKDEHHFEQNITNRHVPETLSVSGEKTWDDESNRDGLRPDFITVSLYANGEMVPESYADVFEDTDGKWIYSFENVPKYSAGKKITYSVMEDQIPEGYSVRVSGMNLINTHVPETVTVSGEKTWDDENNRDGIRPDSITVYLYADGTRIPGSETAVSADADGKWTYSFENVPKYSAGREIAYSVMEDPVPEGYSVHVSGMNLTNTRAPEKITISGTKVWKDDDDRDKLRPDAVWVYLIANGRVTDAKQVAPNEGETDSWSFSFKNVPKNAGGVPICYTVSEEAVPGYTNSVSGSMESGFTITNTHIPDSISVSGEKTWDDSNDQDGVRPERIRITLYKDGEEWETQTADAGTGWKYIFANIPKNTDGQPSGWTIVEDTVERYEEPVYRNVTPKGETKNYTIHITNKHIPETISVHGEKTWEDGNNQDGLRPDSVKVYLYADGVMVPGSEKTITGDSGWTYSFENVPKYKNGREITYSVMEDPIPEGYSVQVSGMNLTNTHVPEMITVSGEKTWEDDNNRDGVRPDSITVYLYADGVRLPGNRKTVISDANGKWTYSFKNVPKYRNGQEITYSVMEDPIPDQYSVQVSGMNLTDIHEPEKITVSGTKTWDDNGNEDGLRPDKILVYLIANGRAVDAKEVARGEGETDNWSFSFENVPKNAAGQPITYMVDEEAVPGYTKKVSGSMDSGFTITNKRNVDAITVKGQKTWDDADDQDGIRPEDIRITLMKDGEEWEVQWVNAVTDWKYSFMSEGSQSGWTIVEDTVEGYDEPVYSNMTPDGETKNFTINITNKHTPDTTTVSGRKIWNDRRDMDMLRPASVKVYLYADGTKVYEEEKTVTADEKGYWKYSFENVPKYKAGREIAYTVAEDPVPEGYSVQVSGRNLINTHVPETVTVSGEKTWDDEHNKGLSRPDSITVILCADGVQVPGSETTVTPDAYGKWKYTFANVPKYKNGIEIIYSVTEDPVPGGYEVQASGMNLTNILIPEAVTVSGEKTWQDDSDRERLRPDKITLYLNEGDRQIRQQTVTADTEWKYSFENLQKYRKGEEIHYYVTEGYVGGYYPIVSGMNLTNIHIPETVIIKGEKTWDDDSNRDGIRPDKVTVILLADGAEAARQEVTAETDWKYTFYLMPILKDGRPVTYTVKEEPVPDGYTAQYRNIRTDENGSLVLDIVNEHTPEVTTISGVKTWQDNNDQDGLRPRAIRIRLLADGEPAGEMIATAEKDWRYTFRDVPKNQNGREITYTVEENTPEGYTAVTNGYDITNIHEPVKISVSGMKTWDDGDDKDGLRPDSVTVILYGNGNKYAEKTVTAEDGWKFTFRNVQENAGGKPITYTVDEVPVAGYEKSVDGTTITNKHIPGTVGVSGTKTWDDEDDRDGIRPDSVTVKLLKNGTEIESRETTADLGWKYSFANLPKDEHGMVIRYTVIEDPVPEGYTSEINGYEIINSHDPAEPKTYTITYDPNGGTLDGSTEPVSTEHEENEVITIREAPVRKGYSFLYWKGSEYQPGDEYTVTEDHTFVAQWEKETDPSPYQYKFTFTKKWSGGHGDSIDWTLYNPDGTVAHKKFNKKVVSDTEWHYEAWFASEKDYYIIETAPAGYKVRYENTGIHADVTDRCYNGGTIINYKIPKTGDNRTASILWVGCVLLGLLGIGGALFTRKRRKGR